MHPCAGHSDCFLPQPDRYKQVADVVARTARRAGVRLIPVPVLPMPEAEFADVPGILAYRAKYTRAAPPFIALAVRFERFFRSKCERWPSCVPNLSVVFEITGT